MGRALGLLVTGAIGAGLSTVPRCACAAGGLPEPAAPPAASAAADPTTLPRYERTIRSDAQGGGAVVDRITLGARLPDALWLPLAGSPEAPGPTLTGGGGTQLSFRPVDLHGTPGLAVDLGPGLAPGDTLEVRYRVGSLFGPGARKAAHHGAFKETHRFLSRSGPAIGTLVLSVGLPPGHIPQSLGPTVPPADPESPDPPARLLADDDGTARVQMTCRDLRPGDPCGLTYAHVPRQRSYAPLALGVLLGLAWLWFFRRTVHPASSPKAT